jgi:hypothetical protein
MFAEAGVLVPQPPARVAVENTTDWVVEGTAARGTDVKVAPFLGRDALWLRNSTQAIRTGVRFADGTIEFDLAPMDRGDFVGLVFRRESFGQHENVYLRLRRSGDFMAVQYAPRMNGSSTWQLYPQFTAKTLWPRNVWTPVKLRVAGSTLEVTVGDATSPTLTVPRLRQAIAAGEVAFWARVNDRPAEWAAALSNIRIHASAQAVSRVEVPAPPAGVVAQWEVSDPVAAAAAGVPIASVPASLTWSRIQTEETGLVNLNARYRVMPAEGRRTVFLRAVITSAVARRALAGIGYSDDVTVFLNGEPLYAGTNGWDTRTPEFVSFVDPRFERVWLSLRAGTNELVLAVTDDQRFGWGAAVTVEPGGGR